MNDIQQLIDSYIAVWNEPDAERRRALVGRTFVDDATYLDPLMTGTGIDGIAGMVGGAQAQYPGHRFELVQGPDAHHDRVRFAWRLVNGDGGHVAIGIDFATLAEDGRLREVTGFLEPAA